MSLNASKLDETPPQKLLIVRMSAIGDIVFASPFAKAIKTTFPNAHIAWLVEQGNEALLADSPYVDECVTMPAGEWRALWRNGKKWAAFRQIRAFGAYLKAQRFDTVIDLQGLLKSGIFAWMSAAHRRIGLGSREGSQWMMNATLPREGIPERISSEYLYLAEQMRLDTTDFMPTLPVNALAEECALDTLADRGLRPGQYAVFTAFTTRPQKHWFADAWQALAAMVRAQTSLTPVLLGGSADRPAAATILSAAPDVVNLTGQTRLAEAVAIIRHAGALIGVDTGLTHMGIAFAIPTVALFGSTCPYTDTQRDNAKVIWLGMSCSPCRRKPSCTGKWECMRNITPERVMTELHAVLAHNAAMSST
ncbi:MAG: glycosyltransferase family 9 protein [Burkholderiaceae bacterium]|jgi:heptosyltransferase-1|nr:glycosyltransferase family 9 protein [Burkholderiaceae bacterium]